MRKTRRVTGEPLFVHALRKAIRDSGQSVGEIAGGSGVPRPVVSRFLDETRPNIRSDTAGKIMRHLGLTICKR